MPVSLDEHTDYEDFIFKPMDLTKLEKVNSLPWGTVRCYYYWSIGFSCSGLKSLSAHQLDLFFGHAVASIVSRNGVTQLKSKYW